jgi:hypothetical protein
MQRISMRNLNRIIRSSLALLDPDLTQEQVNRRLRASEKRAARGREFWEEFKK